jgi:tetratricopeptide (TPR) repeat protein
LLGHTAAFAEHQFGKRIAGKANYERNNGDCISAWDVEIYILCNLYRELHKIITSRDDSDNAKDFLTKGISYLQKSIEILEFWILQIGLNERERAYVLTVEKIDCLFDLMSLTEFHLGLNYRELKDMDKALHYSEQSVYHAKQMKEGEIKTKRVFDALNNLSETYSIVGKIAELKAVTEEAYTSVSEIYNPEHPLVLKAGGNLIEILCMTGDFYDAERFARMYDALTRLPLDPESFEAVGAGDRLAFASCLLIKANGPESADIDEAEMLARKAVRIVKELKGPGSESMRYNFNVLVEVLALKEDYSDTTKDLLEVYLSDAIRSKGRNGRIIGHAFILSFRILY